MRNKVWIASGTIGLWGPDHFVVYYRDGQVQQPGIVIPGDAKGKHRADQR